MLGYNIKLCILFELVMAKYIEKDCKANAIESITLGLEIINANNTI